MAAVVDRVYIVYGREDVYRMHLRVARVDAYPPAVEFTAIVNWWAFFVAGENDDQCCAK